MKWPWVSREKHEEVVKFWQEHAARMSRHHELAVNQTSGMLDLYEDEIRESSRLRAEANTMRGILEAHKIDGRERFGPYFDTEGPIRRAV